MSGLYATPRTRIFEPFSDFCAPWFSACEITRAAEVRHVLVDLAGELDELGVEVVLARLPREVERVDRDAVPAEARARARSDMKPNGFVAAASTTSQTSMPIRSQSCASSLTSAMLTERKMFSSSFVSSAASGEETVWTVSIAPRRARRRPRSRPRRSRRRSSASSSSSSPCGRGRRARARTRGGSRRPPCRPLPSSSIGRSTSRGSCPGTSSTRARRGGPCAGAARSRATARLEDRRVRLALVRERRRERRSRSRRRRGARRSRSSR